MVNTKEEVPRSSSVDALVPVTARAVDVETKRTYQSHWKGFVAWCESKRVCALPVEPASGRAADASHPQGRA